MTHRLDHHSKHLTSSNLFHQPVEHLFSVTFTELPCCWISRLLFRRPSSCALLLLAPWTSERGPTPHSQFMPFGCENNDSTIATHPQHFHSRHFQKELQKIAVGQAWLAAHWSCWRQHFLAVVRVPTKDVRLNSEFFSMQLETQNLRTWGSVTEKSDQLSWASQGHRTLGDQSSCSSWAIVAA